MYKLTRNYDCWVTDDGSYFAVRNLEHDTIDGGYELGEWASFQDGSARYAATIIRSNDSYKAILKKV